MRVQMTWNWSARHPPGRVGTRLESGSSGALRFTQMPAEAHFSLMASEVATPSALTDAWQHPAPRISVTPTTPLPRRRGRALQASLAACTDGGSTFGGLASAIFDLRT